MFFGSVALGLLFIDELVVDGLRLVEGNRRLGFGSSRHVSAPATVGKIDYKSAILGSISAR